MLRQRITTAIFLVLVIGGVLVYLPPWAFQLLVLLGALFALAEFNRLALSRLRFYRIVALCVGMGTAAVQTWRPVWLPIDLWLIAALFLVALCTMWRATIFERYVERVAVALCGSLYIGLTLPLLGWLRVHPHGIALVVMTLTMVAAADSAAYTVGRTMGRHPMAQASPNKTMEGFVAGFGGSVLAILVCRALLWPALPLWPSVGLGLIIGFVAPMGDLIESAIKRSSHVKDSGTLLPGHGGMLDRVDAYLFSAPVVYYYVRWVVV